jgi:hypothetical protein
MQRNICARPFERWDAKENYSNTCRFPVTRKLKEGGLAVRLCRVIYSSSSIHGRQYRSFPLADGRQCWFVDDALMHDTSTSLSFMSSLTACNAREGCYISVPDVERPNTLSGASLGLAVAMCVLGAKNLVYTGFVPINPFGGHVECPFIGPIEAVEEKMEYVRQVNEFLFVPSACVPESALTTAVSRRRLYSFTDYLKGAPIENDMRGIVVASLSECIVISQALMDARR